VSVSQTLLDELWDFADPVGSEARLRGAGEAATDPATHAELETQIARALGLQERFDDADAVLDAVSIEDAAVAARTALERGRLRTSAGRPDAAVAYFLAAADAASGDGLVFLQVDALHMLAIAEPEQSETWTDAALRALETSDDPRTLRWRVSLHNNAGWADLDAGRLADAIAHFEAARDAAIRWGTPQQVVWADEALAQARDAAAGGSQTAETPSPIPSAERTAVTTDEQHSPDHHVPLPDEPSIPELEADETVPPRPEEPIADALRAEPDVEDHSEHPA
jgi:tetratricopeptide (TPR) repeat protein